MNKIQRTPHSAVVSNMKTFRLFLILLLGSIIVSSDSEYCQAIDFMCKPKRVTKQTSRHIARWLEKVKAMPDCFVGQERETVEHSDSSVEVIGLRDGVRSGVGARYSSRQQQYLLSLTLYSSGLRVGPVWDLTMGRGYNASYHFHPRSSSVKSNLQEAEFLLTQELIDKI